MTVSSRRAIWAIIPASGVGSRMGAKIAKQYLYVHDKTIVEHSVTRLLGNSLIKDVILCLSPADKQWEKLGFSDKRLFVASGGETRAQSVLNGLIALENKARDDEWVLVHDAARPCLPETILNDFIKEIISDNVGGLLAIPVNDTLKQSTQSDTMMARSEKTLDRSVIWQAQTPQMFRYGLLKEALTTALSQQLAITDEASAIELLGLQPKLVMGTTKNLKVTTKNDLLLAEIFLKPSRC